MRRATRSNVIGTSHQVHLSCRTIGHKIEHANAALQKANSGPPQPTRYGDFTKNPLVLHITAAASTKRRALRTDGAGLTEISSAFDVAFADCRFN
jgi:hypothetical protein